MYRHLRIAVVVPAYNEERAIAGVLAATPAFVDRIVVVDDGSHDETASRALRHADPRVELVRHTTNRGVGGAIVTGYRRALACGDDVAVVMAGDGQMDPADLSALLDPIAAGRADYCKGNRFAHPELWRVMPVTRLLGNVALSLATKLSSGYWHVFDSQCGYTAITRVALAALDLDQLFPRYGYPNDLLARLAAVGARVTDVPVRPIYGRAWRSGIKPHNVIYPVTFVLARSWVRRVGARWSARDTPVLEP